MDLNKKEIFLRSQNICLRPLDENYIDGKYSGWLNDPEITLYNSHGRFPMTQEKLVEYVKMARTLNSILVMAIIHSETNTHIGNISLQSINWIDRSAEIAFLMGEKKFQGKGLMFEAGQLIIDHAFTSLNLHRIHCGTSAENIGMQKLATRLGMSTEGLRKDALFKNGKYIDIIEYGLINPNEIL
jgi:RimJ/RimL family protein N-acetyltransferase